MTAEIVNFLVLLAILSFVFYRKIFSVIEERQNK
ncbi:MAG TPA: ATP F0F1 synthase subunit B, partial [Candidatus Pacebacteria bacterium]|nr:ATP F0F1 synthase subunit B [Candidatus Paceibacterota bacterium]